MRKPIEEFFWWKAFVAFNRGLLLFCCLSAVGTIFASVLLRYVFKSDLYGLEEIVTLATMWLYFMGGVDGSYEDSHIDADVLSLAIKSEKTKRILKIIIKAICLIVSIFFCKMGHRLFELGGHCGWRDTDPTDSHAAVPYAPFRCVYSHGILQCLSSDQCDFGQNPPETRCGKSK